MRNHLFALLGIASLLLACSGGEREREYARLKTFGNCGELQSYVAKALQPPDTTGGQESTDYPRIVKSAPLVSQNDSAFPSTLEEGNTVNVFDNRLVSLQGNKILVLNIQEPANIKNEAVIDLSAEKMALIETIYKNNRLIVIGRNLNYRYPYYDSNPREENKEDPFQTKILVINMIEPSHPKIIKRLWLTSGYSESRVSADNTRLFIVSSIETLYWEKQDPELPVTKTLGLQKEEENSEPKPLCKCEDVIYLDQGTPSFGTSIATTHVHSLDLTRDEPLLKNELSFLGQQPKLRATTETFLFAFTLNPHAVAYMNFPQAGDRTYLALATDENHSGLNIIAEGTVEGTVSEQFNMQATKEIVHVFTSINDSGHIAPSGNRLTTLRVKGDALTEVSRLDGLGHDEFLFSTIFGNQMAFAVTFKKTDPFYVIDLANPLKPILRGELKITGHTRQLQIVSPDTVLAIGREADDYGDFALYDEIHVSLYGITKNQEPYLIQRELFGSRESRCDAAGEGWWSIGDQGYKAYLYDSKAERLLLPMTIAKSSMVRIFRLSHRKIVSEGLFTHASYITRVLQVGNHYFAVSDSEVSSHAVSNPSAKVGSLNISN